MAKLGGTPTTAPPDSDNTYVWFDGAWLRVFTDHDEPSESRHLPGKHNQADHGRPHRKLTVTAVPKDATKWLHSQERDLKSEKRPLQYRTDLNDPVSRPLVGIADHQGFSGKPKRGNVDDVIASGGLEIHRGVVEHKRSGTSAKDINDKLVNGAYEPGHGKYGNGYYFTTSPGIARMYADRAVAQDGYNAPSKKGGVTQRAALPKDANIIDYHEIAPMQDKWHKENYPKVHFDTYSTNYVIPEGKISPTLLDVMSDPGHFAAAMGFDAIRVPPRDRDRDRLNKQRILKFTKEDSLGDEIVVLNRSILVVE